MSSSKCYNGRINIIQPDTNKLFARKDKIAYDSKTTEYREALMVIGKIQHYLKHILVKTIYKLYKML